MKRLSLILVVVLLCGTLAWALACLVDRGATAPRFVAGPTQLAAPVLRNYVAVPFTADKLWLWTLSGRTNCYLYNIATREIEGELFEGDPMYFDRSGTKLVCHGHSAPGDYLKAKVRELGLRLSGGRVFVGWGPQREAFWVLDLRNNSATRVGVLSQLQGSTSSFIPSPGLRFAYTTPSTSWKREEFFLCDIEKRRLKRVRPVGGIRGRLCGWWDDHRMLFNDRAGDLVLFDVLTSQTEVLFSAKGFAGFLHQNGLTNSPREIASYSNPIGCGYDIYFNAGKGLPWGQGWLIKADQHGPSLSLISTNLQFHGGIQLDAKATRYLYEGSGGPPHELPTGGVYLYDMTNRTTLTLVSPDNGRHDALPMFYRDSVIYFRTGQLWRVDLDGSHTAPLLPPELTSPAGAL